MRSPLSHLISICVLGAFHLIGPAPLLAQDTLVLISPHPDSIKTELGAAFEKWYRVQTTRSVTLDWRDVGATSDDLRFIVSEFKSNPNSIGIDLFFGGGIDPYLELKQQQLLQRYEVPEAILEEIPPDLAGLPLYDPEKFWFGTALSSFGILKNESVVQQLHLPEARTWRDLTNPALRGWVGSGDPRNSGANHMIYESILQAYGWEEGWKVIEGIGANVRQFDRNGSATAKACTLGNVAYSLVIDFYGFTQMAEAGPENMSMIIPPGESVLNPDSIAMLKGAPHLEVAQRFINFILSDAGQSLWLAPAGHPGGPQKFRIERMAIRPKLYDEFEGITLVKINPFRNLQPLHYNAQLGGARWSALNALLGALVMDRSAEERLQFRPPPPEETLNAIVKKSWKDPIERNRIQLSWQQMP